MDKLIKRFIKRLKNKEIRHYVCNRCGYSQGHQIVYCPKCPGKMKYQIETEYEDFRRDKKILQGCYYKQAASELNGEYLDHESWVKIINKIKA